MSHSSPQPRSPLDEALAHQAAGRHGEAAEAYRRHLEKRPADAAAWAHLGGELGNLDRLPEAVEACHRALTLAPRLETALVNLGLAFARQERYEEGAGFFRQALEERPDDLFARLGLAECLIQTERGDDAIRELEEVLLREPANARAFKRLLQIHHLRGDGAGLFEVLNRWIAVDPGSSDRIWERGSLHMLNGRFREGWADFEARFGMREQPRSPMVPMDQPRWNGEPFPGKTLLLHWEQGFGDTIMFVRFAKEAKARGGRVVALVQPPLAELIATCDGIDEVVAHGAPLPPFDLYLPLMSLPWLFDIDETSLPGEVPYLGVPAKTPNREALHRILSIPTERVRIGYAWAGNPGNLNDRSRSLPLEALAPLAELPGVAWHCFQLPAPEMPPLPSVPLSPLLATFGDTAFALSFMDLVITVDTALAHLAGALGIPTFLLLRYGSEWRWQWDRPDSPWYPTLRIYRQDAPGDWDSAIRHLVADLSGD
ncbi:tetratricopeptide repeat protein [Geothrix sp. 21YS21S-4]|uniref:tetratricopeptide repeat-containing glycosyltransferase family protein n=1 Tax=Geothrix sp. 21YS21S-4 TaxID=3068889 RepID=UPI0027B9274A|nr:tetratricopeptide repeat protein [Geothrix sp. 21YS21S-4]